MHRFYAATATILIAGAVTAFAQPMLVPPTPTDAGLPTPVDSIPDVPTMRHENSPTDNSAIVPDPSFPSQGIHNHSSEAVFESRPQIPTETYPINGYPVEAPATYAEPSDTAPPTHSMGTYSYPTEAPSYRSDSAVQYVDPIPSTMPVPANTCASCMSATPYCAAPACAMDVCASADCGTPVYCDPCACDEFDYVAEVENGYYSEDGIDGYSYYDIVAEDDYEIDMYYGGGQATTAGLHVRHPFYSYRHSWYSPGPASLNVTIAW